MNDKFLLLAKKIGAKNKPKLLKSHKNLLSYAESYECRAQPMLSKNKEIYPRLENLRYRPRPLNNLPKMFFFTDRKRLADIFITINELPENTAIIIREYDLSKDQRLVFAQKIAAIAKKKKLKVLVGKDYNLARKIDADGVHFSDRDQIFCKNKNRKMLLSYSCHSFISIIEARKLNADLVFYSPIFISKSHPDQQNPVGLYNLRKFVMKNAMPVYALGGINENNIKLLINSGISGVAGISMFTTSQPQN